MQTELDHIWDRVQAQLGAAVSDSTYRIWLEPLRAVELADERLVVAVSTRTSAWVSDRFGRLLQTCVSAVLGPEVAVDLIAIDDPQQRASAATAPSRGRRRPTAPSSSSVSATAGPARQSGEPALHPKLTFEQFVIGDSNRLAHAAALAVAEMPAQAYNPLFIYGPPGLGKTHLLHSIATYIVAHGGGMTVRYTTGEAFTGEFISALHGGALDDFKARFRHVDVLLIDDIQFLERKTRTEEEFFHTFNALSEIGSQVVVTSDRLPRDLEALEDRLRERFEAGLVADIRPPDLPTRLTILRKRVNHDRIHLDDPEALRVIAEHVSQNIRTLEGALIRVVAYASLTSRPITAMLAREVMDNLYPPARPPRSVADIRALTAQHFGVSDTDLTSASRAARVAWARQVAMYLARELTDESLPAIGREFGGRDHSTVLHACRRAEARLDHDPEARDAVITLRERLQDPRS